jgi:hypothetical protein
LGEVFRGFNGRDFGPLRLVNANLIKDGGELVSVLGHINLLGVRSENLNTSLLEAQRDILWQLACPIIGNVLS